ncbi:unnamed protein product, partial [Polarella glacialis]
VVTYTATLAAIAACDAVPVAQALSLIQDMQRRRVMPAAPAYNAALGCCRRSLSWAAALDLLADIRRRRLLVDPVGCAALLGTLAAAGATEQLRAFLPTARLWAFAHLLRAPLSQQQRQQRQRQQQQRQQRQQQQYLHSASDAADPSDAAALAAAAVDLLHGLGGQLGPGRAAANDSNDTYNSSDTNNKNNNNNNNSNNNKNNNNNNNVGRLLGSALRRTLLATPATPGSSATAATSSRQALLPKLRQLLKPAVLGDCGWEEDLGSSSEQSFADNSSSNNNNDKLNNNNDDNNSSSGRLLDPALRQAFGLGRALALHALEGLGLSRLDGWRFGQSFQPGKSTMSPVMGFDFGSPQQQLGAALAATVGPCGGRWRGEGPAARSLLALVDLDLLTPGPSGQSITGCAVVRYAEGR